jgi:hypothetical protein
LRPQPQALFRAPYPLERPPEVPSAFLYAREDDLFDDEWSRWIARSLLGLEAIELPSGHFPMLERPAILADILEHISSESTASTDEPIAGAFADHARRLRSSIRVVYRPDSGTCSSVPPGLSDEAALNPLSADLGARRRFMASMTPGATAEARLPRVGGHNVDRCRVPQHAQSRAAPPGGREPLAPGVDTVTLPRIGSRCHSASTATDGASIQTGGPGTNASGSDQLRPARPPGSVSSSTRSSIAARSSSTGQSCTAATRTVSLGLTQTPAGRTSVWPLQRP